MIPVARNNLKTDGRQILELVFGGKSIIRRYVIQSLILSARELRPREWEAGLVTLAFDDSVELNPSLNLDPTMHYLRYQRYADTRDNLQAGEALNRILSSAVATSRPLDMAMGGSLVSSLFHEESAGGQRPASHR